MKVLYIILSDILIFILELIVSFICITRKYKIDTKLQKLEYYKNKFTPYIIKYQILGGIR
jgi:hypothetical protein